MLIVGQHVYLNGTNNRYNFRLGVINDIRRDGTARVALYDLDRPITVSVHPSRLTSALAVHEYAREHGDGDMAVKIACRALRPKPATVSYDFETYGANSPMLAAEYECADDSINFVFASGDVDAIPNDGRRYSVIENSADDTDFSLPDAHAGIVFHDASGAVLNVGYMDPKWITEYTPKNARVMLSAMRTLALLGPETAGKTAIEKRGDTLVVMHRHSRKTILTLNVE